MDNNTVCNPKQNILPDESEFNDYDKLNDTLISLKYLSTMYGTLTTEASNKLLLNTLENLSKDISTWKRNTFNLMFSKGWYKLERQEQNKINTELDELNNIKIQL